MIAKLKDQIKYFKFVIRRWYMHRENRKKDHQIYPLY
jgi:hypothetical protein